MALMEKNGRLNRVVRLGYGAAGGFCLLFALIPALFFRIGHSGVITLFCAGVALIIPALCWPRFRPPVRRAVIALTALGLTAVLFCSILMARQAYFADPPQGSALPIVVLGGKVNGKNPSLMVTRRLLAAEEYLLGHPGAVCVVSGGQGPDESYPEAEVMSDWLQARGVDPDRILRETASTNTEQNLAFSAELLGYPDEIVIATDGFHQLRASIYADILGLRAYSAPAHTPWGLFPSYWVREWLGLPVAWLKAAGGL